MTGPLVAHQALGPGGEFDIVRRLVARWGPLASGIGDDAATLDVPPGERLVVSTDASVEDTHFRRGWLAPEEIGWRAATSALSDLAAMGARPIGVLVALTVPPSWRGALDALGDGIGAAVQAAGAPIVGGDLTAGSDLSLAVTVLGSAAAPVTRAGARAGNALYVTGRLGGPLRALRSLERGAAPSDADRIRFARPAARIAEARWLAAHGATAMIDVSDGLAADLRHLAAASAVSLRVDASRVPRVEGATARDALASGEEYELAVAAPRGLDVAAFEAAFGVPLTEIGEVQPGTGPAAGEVRLTGAGERVDLPPGHDHFST